VTLDGLLGPDRIGRLLGPFASVDADLSISVEDASGNVLATAGSSPGADGNRRRVSRDLEVDGSVIGHLVVLAGPEPDAGGEAITDAADERTRSRRLIEALAEAVGASLEMLLAEATARRAAEMSQAATAERALDGGGSRLDAELALARRIQRSFVPLTSPDIPGYEIASHYEAAREVGGDFFDVFRLRSHAGRLAIVIADVTGKGIAAALLMAFARPLLHSAIDNTAAPVAALDRTNRILAQERGSALFITALCAILELRTGRLRVANAGHEPPLIVPAGDGPMRWLSDSGPLLGAFADLDLTECVTDLDEGDLVVLYTDGVTDARAVSGERFGDDRLVATVEAQRASPPVDVVRALAAAVRDYQTGMPPADDVTIVAIRRMPQKRRSRPRSTA
jgi:serine phosphatase RsbU (regulator of sigma subunit)